MCYKQIITSYIIKYKHILASNIDLLTRAYKKKFR